MTRGGSKGDLTWSSDPTRVRGILIYNIYLIYLYLIYNLFIVYLGILYTFTILYEKLTHYI